MSLEISEDQIRMIQESSISTPLAEKRSILISPLTNLHMKYLHTRNQKGVMAKTIGTIYIPGIRKE